MLASFFILVIMDKKVYTHATEQLVKRSLQNTMTYTNYRNLVATLATKGKSTGENQTEALTNYTKLNDRRMRRLDKTIKIALLLYLK